MTTTYPSEARDFYSKAAFPKPGKNASKVDRNKQLRDDAAARKAQLKAHPWCECGAKATAAHHVIFKGMGGTRTEVGDRELKSLCGDCHRQAHGLGQVAS